MVMQSSNEMLSINSLSHYKLLTTLIKKTLENIVRKGKKKLVINTFFLSPIVFNHTKDRNHHMNSFQIVIFKCFEFGPV